MPISSVAISKMQKWELNNSKFSGVENADDRDRLLASRSVSQNESISEATDERPVINQQSGSDKTNANSKLNNISRCQKLGELLSSLIQKKIRAQLVQNSCFEGDLSSFLLAFEPDVRKVISTYLDQCLILVCQVAFDHIDDALRTQSARGDFIAEGLTEVQDFLIALKKINRRCAERNLRHPKDDLILELMEESGYSHPAFQKDELTAEKNMAEKLKLPEKANRIFDVLWPKCRKAIEEVDRGPLAVVKAPLLHSKLAHHIEKYLKSLCLTGLTELTEQLSSKEFWTSALNDGLAQCTYQLQRLHIEKMKFPPNPSDDQEMSCGAHKLAQCCAQTSSAFFNFIPLFQQLQTFFDRLFHPAMAVGQRWSEEFFTKSTIYSVNRFLQTPIDQWTNRAICQLQFQVDPQIKRSIKPISISSQVLITARKMLSTASFYPVYAFNSLCGKLIKVRKQADRHLANWAKTLSCLRPILQLGLQVRRLATLVAQCFWYFRPIILARQVATWAWMRLVNCFISPFAYVVANHVNERFEELSQSPVKQVFVHRVLDLLMRHLNIN